MRYLGTHRIGHVNSSGINTCELHVDTVPPSDISIIMSSGRGGAGNILAVQQERARITADVEASHQQTAEPTPAQQQTSTQEYAHSGRGGAGNYYSPKDLKETGRFSHQNPIANANASGPVPTNAVPVVKYGRGGAGNMSYGVTESEEKAAMKKIEAERLKREEIEVESAREAANSIAMPPQAKLPLPGNDPHESF